MKTFICYRCKTTTGSITLDADKKRPPVEVAPLDWRTIQAVVPEPVYDWRAELLLCVECRRALRAWLESEPAPTPEPEDEP